MKLRMPLVFLLTMVVCQFENFEAMGQSERLVQVRSIDFAGGVVEVHNFGKAAIDLTGWRFCSHDFDEERKYTPPNGLNGLVLNANGSLFVHFNNDAPIMDANAINRGDIGGSFALPLDQDAYAMQLFFPNEGGDVMFGDSSLIADHLQWNLAGMAAGDSLERSNQAVSEGLWADVNDFILTTKATTRIDLVDDSGDVFGESAEYATFTIVGDVNGDGSVSLLDVAPFVELISNGQFQGEADINGDGHVDLLDIAPFVDLLTG